MFFFDLVYTWRLMLGSLKFEDLWFMLDVWLRVTLALGIWRLTVYALGLMLGIQWFTPDVWCLAAAMVQIILKVFEKLPLPGDTKLSGDHKWYCIGELSRVLSVGWAVSEKLVEIYEKFQGWFWGGAGQGLDQGSELVVFLYFRWWITLKYSVFCVPYILEISLCYYIGFFESPVLS